MEYKIYYKFNININYLKKIAKITLHADDEHRPSR